MQAHVARIDIDQFAVETRLFGHVPRLALLAVLVLIGVWIRRRIDQRSGNNADATH